MDGLIAKLLTAGDPVQEEQLERPWSSKEYVCRASAYDAKPLLLRGSLLQHPLVTSVSKDDDKELSTLLEEVAMPGEARFCVTRIRGLPLRYPVPREDVQPIAVEGVTIRDVVCHGERHQKPYPPHGDGDTAARRGHQQPQEEDLLYYVYGPLRPEEPTEVPGKTGGPEAFLRPPTCLTRGGGGGGDDDEGGAAITIRQANVWVGRNLTSRIHVDGVDNLLCCLMGRKILHLYAPDQTAALDPAPPDRLPVESRVGSYLFFEADKQQQQHPRFAKVERMVADLGPGDSLFIPAGVWHEVFTFTAFSVSVNYWCDILHPRCRLRPSLLHIRSEGRYGEFLRQRQEEDQGEGGDEQRDSKGMDSHHHKKLKR